MKSALVIQIGQLSDTILLTGVIKKLIEDGNSIHCVVDRQSGEIFRYIKNTIIDSIDAPNLQKEYTTAINLSPQITCTSIMEKVSAENKFGYGVENGNLSFFNYGAEVHYKHKYMGEQTKSNLFQLIFNLAGYTWQGEGYHLPYFPRNKTKKYLTGLVIRDQLLRSYIRDNIKLSQSKTYTVPFKRDILKQIDEMNRCKNIVTDDFGIMHLGLALRKGVEMIVKRKPSFEIEMFGSGNMHIFDHAVLKDM